ncbi:cellulose biosynthesis cyclic di-GMP-binding regulatory protein BcsB [Leucobacter chironomi]|uniref:cellulose biosynthesis cyclic di-GMP-binding regulatory protein BcsB n=1 Tax=Leucobacter chironomi TaxID=491918 RepID=UPI00041C2B71|nr:cellulose biosynthesis cyclic di-GMP-binding regulatory protein BcsB [Leucobacter chironomi]
MSTSAPISGSHTRAAGHSRLRRAPAAILSGVLVLASLGAGAAPALAHDGAGAKSQVSPDQPSNPADTTAPAQADDTADRDSSDELSGADAATGPTSAQSRSERAELASGGTVWLPFFVPDGTTPQEFTARLSLLAGDGASEVQVSSERRHLGTVTPADGEISLALSEEDVVDGRVNLAFSLPWDTGRVCWVASDTAQREQSTRVAIADAAIDSAGEATPPETVGAFLAPWVEQVEVVTGGDPQLLEAGLSAVAAATHRLGSESSVSLDAPAAETPDPVTRRVIAFEAGSGPAVTGIDADEQGVPRLVVSGAPEKLAAAAAALGSAGLPLASAAETEGLAAAAATQPDTARSLTLEDLGTASVSLRGYGVTDGFIDVPQDAFGGPVDGYTLRLTGAVSTVDSATVASAEVLWNDVLVDTLPISGDKPRIDREIEIPATSVRASNGLVVRLTAVAAGGACIDESLLPQVRLDLDTRASTVTAHRGQAARPGFDRFPQALGGALTVATGSDTPGTTEVQAAGSVVAALQRVSSRQLDISVDSAQQLIDSAMPGLLVGATPDQANALRTPLRLDRFRTLAPSGSTELTVAVDQPYAALMAFESGDRDLLVVGGWAPEGEAPDALIASVAGDLDGTDWYSLSGVLRFQAESDEEPELLDINAVVPQQEYRDDYTWLAWVAIGGLVLLLAIVGIAAAARRRRLVATRQVEAEAAEAAATDTAAADETASAVGAEPVSGADPLPADAAPSTAPAPDAAAEPGSDAERRSDGS